MAVKTVDDLALCGIDAASIALRWRDFSDRNSLAGKDLAALLVRTRFDTPLLLSWVDRAILGDVAGAQLCCFDRAGITSATHLLHLVRHGPGVDLVMRSLAEAHDRWLTCTLSADQAIGQPRGIGLTQAMLVNLVLRIEASPNVALIQAYLRNSQARIRPNDGDRCPLPGDAAARQDDRALPAPQLPAAAPGLLLDQGRAGQPWLTSALLMALAGIYGWAANAIGQTMLELSARWDGLSSAPGVYVFGINYALVFLLLVSLPLLMILGYRGVKGGVVFADARRSLERCGLDRDVVDARMRSFHASQSLWAYLLAMLVNLALLYATWNMALLPAGLGGLAEVLRQGATEPRISASLAILRVAQDTTLLVWVMLGASAILPGRI